MPIGKPRHNCLHADAMARLLVAIAILLTLRFIADSSNARSVAADPPAQPAAAVSDKASNPFVKNDRAVFGCVGIGSWEKTPSYHQKNFAQRNLPPTTGDGYFISEIGPLHSQGLEVNDILIRIDDKKIDDSKSFAAAYARLQIGKPVPVYVKRVHQAGETRKWKTIPIELTPVSNTAVIIRRREAGLADRVTPVVKPTIEQLSDILEIESTTYEDPRRQISLFESVVAAIRAGDESAVIQALSQYTPEEVNERDQVFLNLKSRAGQVQQADMPFTQGQIWLNAWAVVYRSLGQDAIKGGQEQPASEQNSTANADAVPAGPNGDSLVTSLVDDEYVMWKVRRLGEDGADTYWLLANKDCVTNAQELGKWRLRGNVVTLMWRNGFRDEFTIDSDGTPLSGVSHSTSSDYEILEVLRKSDGAPPPPER